MNPELPRYATFDGLDGTGKSKLIELLQPRLDAFVLRTPPNWMKPLRETFNNAGVHMRFLYYSVGNLWVDRFMLRPFLDRDEERFVFQDRSWLSTLTAHDLRGLSKDWLAIGVCMAKSCVRPDISFIVHVDPDVRYERLMNRPQGVDATDLQNFQYADRIEGKHLEWAGILRWNANMFDNTTFTPTEACEAVARYLMSKRG